MGRTNSLTIFSDTLPYPEGLTAGAAPVSPGNGRWKPRPRPVGGDHMERRWAVLRSQPRREAVAARAVSARSVESYLPWLPGARASESARPLFRGYLFARITPGSDDLLRIRSAPGVAYVLP